MRFEKDLSLGDEIYFVGFPFGIGAHHRIEPLVRSGSIAWISENSREFLLDAFSFGGNSGSPVFLKRLIGTKPGVLRWEKPFLVGMITGHHSIRLENVLTQPDPSVLKFEKGTINLNLGLARCVWVDDILHIANKAQELNDMH